MDVIRFLQLFATPFLDAFFLAVTDLGSEDAYIALLVIGYLAVSPLHARRVALAFLPSMYLNQLLKGAFATPRPFEIDPSVLRSGAAYETALGPGFPSGHAQGTATFWAMAALQARRRWFTALAVTLIALVALSRLYLGVHVPADVLGGLLLGLAVATAAAGVVAMRPRVPAAPRALVVGLGLALPLAVHLVAPLLVPVPESDVLTGGFAAFLTAPLLLPWEAGRGRARRAAAALLGLALVFGLLLGSSLLLPEGVKDLPLVGFLRYLLIGWTGTLLAPWLAIRFGWGRRRWERRPAAPA